MGNGSSFCNQQTVMSHMVLESQYVQNQEILNTNLREDQKGYILSHKLPCFKQKGERQKYFCGRFKDGKAEGEGVVFTPDHQFYKGMFARGLPSGRGYLESLNRKQIYEGNFLGGVAHGRGKLKNSNDIDKQFIFEGQWENGQPRKGILTPLRSQQISSIEISEFQASMQGKITFKNGQTYVGDINQYFEPHGQGEFIYNPASLAHSYKGKWFRGTLNGEGDFKWKDRSQYIGSYVNGRKEGKGNYYEGDWLNGLQHGKGVLYGKNNHIISEGVWIKGELAVNITEEQGKLPLQKMPNVSEHEKKLLSLQIK